MVVKYLRAITKSVLIFVMVSILCMMLSTTGSKALYVQAAAIGSQAEKAARGTVAKIDNNMYAAMEQIPSNISWGIDNPYSCVAPINDFWGSDDNYHIVYSSKNKVYISILDQQMQLIKTIEISKDMPLVGNAVQDKDGNYYIVYGEYDRTGEASDTQKGNKIVMSIVQYDNNGNLLKKLTFTGKETNSYSGVEWGTMEPFNFANCDLIIDNCGVLVCRYGRVMYCGHQSSHTIYVDTATMTRLNYISPYTSHSFDQKVLATSDGGYLFAERSDASHRGIVISKISKNTESIWDYPNFIPFHFRNGYIYQTTYATIAGIAECTNGYVLAGASEKTLSYDTAKEPDFNESRNVFMQVFKKDFTDSSSVQLLQGENRIAEGTYNSNDYCQEGAMDYGVLWLTDYSGAFYASVPKLISIGNDQFLIMWEKKKYDDDYESTPYIESYYMVVAGDGSVITAQTAIQDVRLPEFGDPDYKDGKIYWTTSDGMSSNFIVHCLTIGETMAAKIKVTDMEVMQKDIVAVAGQKTAIVVDFSPSNADNKKLRYEDYDSDIIAIDDKGYITVESTGVTEVQIYSEDNEKLSARVTVYATDSAPLDLKAVNYSDMVMVKLTWKKSQLDPYYEIYRSNLRDSGYEYAGYTDKLFYCDDWVEEGSTYYYKVKASNKGWDEDLCQSPYSNPVAIYVHMPPKNLMVKKNSSTSVRITWAKCKNANGYEIYCYDEATKSYKLLKTITNNTTAVYKKYKLQSGQTYIYKIRAYKIIEGVKHYTSFSKTVKITL